MVSTSDTRPNSATTHPSLHPPLTLRDRLRLVLFLVIPVYARLFISPYLFSALLHIGTIGIIGFSVTHLTRGEVSLRDVSDVIYAVAVSSLVGLSKSYWLTAWIFPDIDGWRGIAINWAWMATSVTFLLPENYGREIHELKQEYKLVYPGFDNCIMFCSGLIVWCFLVGREYSWFSLLTSAVFTGMLIENVYFIGLNYFSLRRTGKTVRENPRLYPTVATNPYTGMVGEPYKNTAKRPGPFVNAYGREFSFAEVLEWTSTGKVRPQT